MTDHDIRNLKQRLEAYKRFYEGVQFAMDTAPDAFTLCAEIDQLTEECTDALSIRH